MDIRTATKIVNEYGGVLEETAHTTYAVSESLLRYEKQLIKQAIKLSLDALRPEDAKNRNLLEIGYMSLANFIAKEESEIVAEFHKAIMSGDLSHTGWKYGDQALKILDRITKEQGALLAEIRNYPLKEQKNHNC